MTSNLQFQREIARIALKASQGNDFALAGSGAIREHGLTDRPTEDVDLFTVQQAAPQFESTVNAVIKALRDNGYSVREDKRLQGFARLNVSDSQGLSSTEIDMGIDWRSSPPVHLEIGEVLDEQDAIGNKIAALFSRGEARDYLDLDSIRQTGRYSDQDLLDLAKNTDPGFDEDIFAEALRHFSDYGFENVKKYNINEKGYLSIKERLSTFADSIENRTVSKEKPQKKSTSDFLTQLDTKSSILLKKTTNASTSNRKRER